MAHQIHYTFYFIGPCLLLGKFLQALAYVRIFLGISVEKRRKTALAGLREGYSWDFQEYPVDILLSGKLEPLSFLSFTDITRNILTIASTLRKFLLRTLPSFFFLNKYVGLFLLQLYFSNRLFMPDKLDFYCLGV